MAGGKWIYTFGDGKAEGEAGMKNLLGGKGANLAEMSNLGLPVPPGFTITTEVCTWYYDNGKSFPPELDGQARAALAEMARLTGKVFGDPANPLLVSVRSGARASMPGMMDTVLNLGLNDVTVEAVAKASGDARFAWDSYRRFITMYSNVVLDVDHGALRGGARGLQGAQGPSSRYRPRRRGLEGPGRQVQGHRRRRRSAPTSRRTRSSSSGARSARCSPPG